MEEYQIIYNIWGTYSDGLLIGCGSIKAHDENEALLRATLDLVVYGNLENFQVNYVEHFDGGSMDGVLPCWNVYYLVDGKWGSYDGVGMIYAKNEDDASRIQALDFEKVDGLNPRMEFSVEPF